MKHEAQELLKSLDAGDNALLNDVIRSVSESMKTASEEDAERHAVAFLMFVREFMPEALEGIETGLPDSSLEKDDDGSYQTHLKNVMADNGHYYFGPISKHMYGIMGKGPGRMDVRGYGPRGKKNPKKSPTHSNAPAQADHGRGSGTRDTHEEITGIVRMLSARDGDTDGKAKAQYDALSEQDKQDLDDIEAMAEEKGITLPSRTEMEAMSHEDLVLLADKLGLLGETRGGTLNVVDSDNSDGKDGFKRRARDISGYAPKAERGAGRNLKQSDNSGFKSALDTYRKNKQRREDGQLEGNIADEDRRLGTISRHDTDTHDKSRPGMKHRVSAQEQADAEAAGIKPGMRGYGTKDQEGTAADQPDMTENKYKVQQNKQKLKQRAKLVETERAHIDSLISGEADIPKKKAKELAGEQTEERATAGAASGGNTAQAETADTGTEESTATQTNGEPGPAWGDMLPTAMRIAEDIKSPDKGATYSGDSLEKAPHTTGYYVSIEGAEKIIPPKKGTKTASVSPMQIATYLRNHKDDIQGANFGFWKYSGHTYLDVSRHFESKEEAEAFAKKNSQAAIYDIAGGKDIEVGAVAGPGAVGFGRHASRLKEEEVTMLGFAEHEREPAVSGWGNNKPRDPQQYRLYAAEEFLMWHGGKVPRAETHESAKPLTTDSMSKEEQTAILQAEVDRIANTAFWKSHFPITPRVVVNTEAPAEGATAHRMTGILSVHPDVKYHTSGVMLHEMVHMVTSGAKQAHGPEYARNHLEAVRAIRGPEVAERLEESYAANKVKVADAVAQSYTPDKKGRAKLKALMEERVALGLELHNAESFSRSPAKVSQLNRRLNELDAEIESVTGTVSAPAASAAKPSPDARGSKEQKLIRLANVIEDGIALRAKSNKIKADGGKPDAALERQIMRNTRRQNRITDNLKDQHQVTAEELAEVKQAARAGTGKTALKGKLADLYKGLAEVVGDENATPEQKQAAIEQSLKDLKSEKNRIIGLLKNKHGMTDNDIRNIREGVLGKPERKPKAAPTEGDTPDTKGDGTEEVNTPEPKVKVKKELADSLASSYERIVYGKDKPSKADVARANGDRKSRAAKEKKLADIEGDHNQIRNKDRSGMSEEMIAAATGQYAKNDVRQGKPSPDLLDNIAKAPYLTKAQRVEAIAERISEGWETGLGINDPEGVSAITGLSNEEAAALLGSQREGVPASEAKDWAEKFFESAYFGGVKRPGGKSKAEWVSEAAQHYVEAVKSGDVTRAVHPDGTPEEKAELNKLFDLSGDISPDEAMETIRAGLKRLGYSDKDLEVTGSTNTPDEEVDDSGTFGGGTVAEDDDFGIPAASASVTRDEAKQVLARAEAQSPAASVQKVLDKNKGTDLTGLPSSPVTVKGTGKLTFGSNKDLQKISEDYNKKNGISTPHPTDYVEVKPEVSARIAAEYERMQHDPENPVVKAAYDALKKETLAQYKHAVENGYSFDFYPEGEDPYPNSPREAVIDLHKNKHMKVFPTLGPDGGFGSDNDEFPNHPLTEVIPGVEWSGKPVTYNDAFRAIHDVYGHGKEGVGFRASGEDNAYRQHAAMFSPEARKALASETRGQNSFVNYGPKGEHNRTATSDTEFAPQKAGLLPDWVADPELHSKGAPAESGQAEAAPSPLATQPGPRKLRVVRQSDGTQSKDLGAIGARHYSNIGDTPFSDFVSPYKPPRPGMKHPQGLGGDHRESLTIDVKNPLDVSKASAAAKDAGMPEMAPGIAALVHYAGGVDQFKAKYEDKTATQLRKLAADEGLELPSDFIPGRIVEAIGIHLAKQAGHDALILNSPWDKRLNEVAILDQAIISGGTPEGGAPKATPSARVRELASPEDRKASLLEGKARIRATLSEISDRLNGKDAT